MVLLALGECAPILLVMVIFSYVVNELKRSMAACTSAILCSRAALISRSALFSISSQVKSSFKARASLSFLWRELFALARLATILLRRPSSPTLLMSKQSPLGPNTTGITDVELVEGVFLDVCGIAPFPPAPPVGWPHFVKILTVTGDGCDGICGKQEKVFEIGTF
jgi:hypothetical protein